MSGRIIVAEDSPTQAHRLRAILENEGYSVEVAPDGQVGLEMARRSPPDLILSDVVMPELDGYGFCRAIKSDDRTRRIPFVLLTERRTPADIIRGLEVGADNFLTKPFDESHLVERIREIFRHLEFRQDGKFEVEIRLTVGSRQMTISADKQQIFELLLATSEELSQVNEALAESQRALESHAATLEEQVSERTSELHESLESLANTMEERTMLFSKVLRAQEEERQRIARDVHDEPMQLMAAAGLRVGLLQERVQDPETKAALQQVYESIDHAASSLRRLMFHLTPAVLEREGLAAAVVAYAGWLRSEWALECHVDYRLRDDPPSDTGVVVYRIVQEALTNIRKHARASNAWVVLDDQERGVRGTVRDDGEGFDPQALDRDWQHIGVESMRERAETAGGWWRIDSHRGAGTTISFWIPAAGSTEAG